MRAFLPLVVLAIGCEETLPIEVGDVDFDYGFLITYPETGVDPIRVSPTFGLEDGEVIFGQQPALDLEDREQRFVFVALTAEQLHPSFDRGRASELEAKEEEPPEIELMVDGIGDRLNAKTRLPVDAQLLTADLEHAVEGLHPADPAEFGVVHDLITLRIPVEPEHCRIQGLPPLRPFAAKRRPLPVSPVGDAIEALFYLDRDRVLAVSRRYVYAIRRGETVTSTHAATVFGVIDDPDRLPRENIRDGAVSEPRADGSRAVVAVGGDTFTEDPLYGRIWPLRLDGDSLVLEFPSQTIFATDTSCVPAEKRSCDLLVNAVTLMPGGSFFAGGADGDIFIRSPAETFFRRAPIELANRTDIPDSVQEIMPIAAGGYDLMVGLKNHIHLRRESDQTWDSQYLMRTGLLGPESLRLGALAAIPSATLAESDYWAGGARGQIARKQGDLEWQLLSDNDRSLYYPPRFLPCASSDDPTGNPRGFARDITAIEAFEDHVFMGHENCNALIVVRRSDQCVSLVQIEGSDIAFSTSYITAIERLDRTLLIGTTGGELYETTIPP